MTPLFELLLTSPVAEIEANEPEKFDPVPSSKATSQSQKPPDKLNAADAPRSNWM
jgi:hypothetical protein